MSQTDTMKMDEMMDKVNEMKSKIDYEGVFKEWNDIEKGPGTLSCDETDKYKIITCRNVYMPFLCKLTTYMKKSETCTNEKLRDILKIAIKKFFDSYNPSYQSNLTVCRDGIASYIENKGDDKLWYVKYTTECLKWKVNSVDQLALDIYGHLESFCSHMDDITGCICMEDNGDV